jgi:hypothetical protein
MSSSQKITVLGLEMIITSINKSGLLRNFKP